MKIEQVERELLQRGIIDENRLFTYATNDTFGTGLKGGVALAGAGMSTFCMFCVKDGVFSLYGSNMKSEIGELQFSCNLSDMKDFKFVSSPPGFSVLKFTVKNLTLKLKAFKNGKLFVQCFRDANLMK